MDEQFDEETLEGFDKIEEECFEFRRKIAVGYGWNFSNFNKLVSQFINRNEDQLVFDYKSYCFCLSETNYKHPLSWAREYYQKGFDNKKHDEFMNRLSRVTKF